MSNEFVPHDHWKEFEEFSIKIVELKFKDAVAYDHIHSWRTQDTVDQGVDGNILISVAGADIRITLEAKLRKQGTIALRDIASSVVNYLIGSSNMHFVVTNVCFTKDAIRIANSINAKRLFSLNYIDCHALSELLEQYPQLCTSFPILAQNIREQATGVPAVALQRTVPSTTTVQRPIPYFTATRKHYADEMVQAVKAQKPLLILKGLRGTDKSILIDDCINTLCNDKVFVRIDMQYVDSARTFLLTFLKDLLGLDIFSFLELLSGKESNCIWEQICSFDEPNAHIAKTLYKLMQYHQNNDSPHEEAFLIREYLKELTALNKIHRVLVIENMNAATKETVSAIMSFLPQIVKMHFSVIVEAALYVPQHNALLSNSDWLVLLEQLEGMRLEMTSATVIPLDEYASPEAVQAICAITQQPKDSPFVRTFIQRFGRNPAVIREVGYEIIQRHITTENELWKIPFPGSNEELKQNLFAVYESTKVRGPSTLIAFCWCIHATSMLYGFLSNRLMGQIENRFHSIGVADVLDQTRLFRKAEDGWWIRNECAEKVLKDTVAYWDMEQLVPYLLNNTEYWGISDIYKQCSMVDMLIAISDDSFHKHAEKAISLCENNGEKRIAVMVLRKCVSQTKNAVTSEKLYIHLCYAYKCLIAENALGLISMDQRKQKAASLLKTCNELYIEMPEHRTAELLVKVNLLLYALCHDQFLFADGEKYVNTSLELASRHGLSTLGAMTYVKKAICIKERMGHKECFEVFRQGIHSYPKDSFLRACYLANYAAHQAKKNINAAIRCAEIALKAARKSYDSELSCWIEEDIFMYRLENKECGDALLKDIFRCRNTADRYGYRADISRTYNLEGTLRAMQGDPILAAQCFRNSLQCFDEAITDQQKFLFRSNLMAILPISECESTQLFERQMQWLERNREWLYKKLLTRKELQSECNFAGLVSILQFTQKKHDLVAFKKIKEWFPLVELQQVDYAHTLMPSELLAPRFLLADKTILILF